MKVTRAKVAPKLRTQILTRQTRSLKSGTGDEIADTISAPVTTQEAEDGSVSIIWTPESEIILFKEMMDYKLVGIKKHFNVIAVTKLLSKAFGFRVNPDAVWQHVNTFYDTKRLEGTVPFKVEQTDFSLPRSFNALKSIVAEKRKQEQGKSTSLTPGNNSTEKIDKDGGASKDGFATPTSTNSENTKEVRKLSGSKESSKNRLSSSAQSSSASSSPKEKGKESKVGKDTKDTTHVKKDLRFKANKERDAKARDKGFRTKERDAKLMLKRSATTPAFNVSKKRRNY